VARDPSYAISSISSLLSIMNADDWHASRARTAGYDMEGERRPVKPHKGADKSTGFTSQLAGMVQDSIMEQAINDRTEQLAKEGALEGQYWDAKEYVTAEEKQADQETNEAAACDRDGGREDEEDDLDDLRARRRKQMKDAMEKRQKNQALGHGSYDEIAEDEFLKTVTSSELSIVHFYHRDFEKCKIMDMHLDKCARKFFNTRFVKLNVEKAHFFVEKLAVKTLPCAVVFINGVAKGKQLGFEGLGGSDDFSTAILAWRFKEWGGIDEDFDPEDKF